MKPQKLTPEQVQRTLTTAVDAAVDFIESEIAPARIMAQKYVDGYSAIGHEDGRSKVVSTVCRDAIRAVKPAIMRLFLQSHKPVEFIPSSPQAVAGAEQATNYARYIFDRNHGFSVLHDVIHDALVKKVGIVKPYYEETTDAEIDEYSGLSQEALQLLSQDPELTVLENEVDEVTGLLTIKVSRQNTRGEIKFESVAPEDFFVDRAAKSIRDCYVCGHSTMGRVGDLVAMGFDFEEVFKLAGDSETTNADAERQTRTGWDDEDDEGSTDPSMRPILITEAYMKMDIEGTGAPVRYKFICAGEDHKILERGLCDLKQPFAIFEVDPEPHTFFGRSLVEIIQDDQDADTALWRGLLDSVALANNPSMEVVQDMVNADDLLNNEVGRIIRVKQPGMLREITMGVAATAVLPALQFYGERIRQKTGVTGAGMGLDVEALSSQTAAGVRLAEQTTAAVSELMARVLAEGGMKQLFEIIAQLARQHPNESEMMRIDGQFVPVDPRSWGTQMDLIANVGLGTGRVEERMMTLNGIAQFQAAVWQAYGPNNGIVSLTGIRNAQADIAKIGGIYNADRYLNQMTPEIEQQLAQQAAEAAAQQPPAPDSTQAYLQAEQMKAQGRMQEAQMKSQLDQQKAQADFQFRAMENQQADDLARDKMLQDLAIKVAELLGKHQVQLNAAAVQQAQEAPRV
jgi:hypothetical protein